MDSKDVDVTAELEETDEIKESKKFGWIIIGLVIALMVVFGLIVMMWFLVFNHPEMHEIVVRNDTGNVMNVVVGSTGTTDVLTAQLATGGVKIFKATPGVYVEVSSGVTGGTMAKIWLNGQDYTGKTYITDGKKKLNVAYVVSYEQTGHSYDDRYSVSMQKGYDMPIVVYPTAYYTEPRKGFVCTAPEWRYSSGLVHGSCPTGLSEDNICASACTKLGGLNEIYCCPNCEIPCQLTWLNYWVPFKQACPNCMITNCDKPLYSCSNNGGLTQYTVSFQSSRPP